MTEFHEDLRNLFLRAGVDGVKCVFILKDEHIVKVYRILSFTSP